MIPDLSRFARAALWDHITPLEQAANISREIGGGPLFVKRDDANGLAFGGNKVRQLEYYLGDALAQGADTILMTGAVQSNFVRTAAAACCKLGLKCHIQLEDRVPKDDFEYNKSGNVLLNQFFGAALSFFSEGEDEQAADAELEQIAATYRADGRKTYVVPMHPSHAPLGALGYLHGARELVDQMNEMAIRPDRIFVGSGSGNTHTGLLVGLRLLGDKTPVTGVCVRRDAGLQAPRIRARCDHLLTMLDTGLALQDDDVEVDDTFLAPGYGRAGPQAREAMLLAARLEGLIVDPVYTSKVLAAAIRFSRAHREKTSIFIHTGGGPAIFGYAENVREMLNEETAPEES